MYAVAGRGETPLTQWKEGERREQRGTEGHPAIGQNIYEMAAAWRPDVLCRWFLFYRQTPSIPSVNILKTDGTSPYLLMCLCAQHNDLQAQARAHRLGQLNPVMIYRQE